MDKHTPTPWWWGRDKKHGGAHNLNSATRPDVDIAIGGTSGFWLLEGIAGNVRARTKADAEFIVRACNSHDGLLAACKAAYRLLRKPSMFPQTREVLHKAIAAAEGE